MKKIVDRIGQERMMNCGMKATIIVWNNYHDITIRFEDGYIKEHVDYGNFVHGEVQHPKLPIVFKTNAETLRINSRIRIGMRKQMRCGLYVEIIAYKNCNDITVRFGDGVISEGHKFCEFMNGTISHPFRRIKGSSYPEFICSKFLAPFGFHKASKGTVLDKKELDLYNEELKIAVEYDGEAWHKTETDLEKDRECAEKGIRLIRIREPKCKDYDGTSIFFRLEEKDSFEALIKVLTDVLAYIGSICGRQFDASANELNKQELDDEWGRMHLYHVGDRRKMNCGMFATIIRIVDKHHIDVQFEDGMVVRNKQYQEFVHGSIMNPNLSFKITRVGLRRMMNCGLYAEIFEYIDNKHIRVRFEDGVVVPGYRYYSHFLEGGIAHPNIKTHRKPSEKDGDK